MDIDLSLSQPLERELDVSSIINNSSGEPEVKSNRINIQRNNIATISQSYTTEFTVEDLTKKVKRLSLDGNLDNSRTQRTSRSSAQKLRRINRCQTIFEKAEPMYLDTADEVKNRTRKRHSEKPRNRMRSSSRNCSRRKSSPIDRKKFHRISKHEDHIKSINLETIENRSLPTLSLHLQQFFKENLEVNNLKIVIDKDREDSIYYNLRISSNEITSEQLQEILETLNLLYDSSLFSLIQLRHIKVIDESVLESLSKFQNTVFLGFYKCMQFNFSFRKLDTLLSSLSQISILNLEESRIDSDLESNLAEEYRQKLFITFSDQSTSHEIDLDKFKDKLDAFWKIPKESLNQKKVDKYFRGCAPYFKMLTQFEVNSDKNTSDKHLDYIFNYIGRYSSIIESIDLSHGNNLKKDALKTINKHLTGKRVNLLDLSHNHKIKDRHLTELEGLLPGLKYLDLTECKKIQLEYVVPYLQDLLNHHGADGQTLIILVDNQPYAITKEN